MEHVSTLCATGTVGIAAAGFALGRPEGQSAASSTRRRRRSVVRINHSSSFAQSVDLPSRASSRCGPSDPAARVLGATDSYPPRLTLQTGENSATVAAAAVTPPPTTVGDLAGAQPSYGVELRPRRRTYVHPAPKRVDDLLGEPSTPSSPQRPSSSWLARLSTITSSVDESSISASGPQTPSTHSPTAPFFPSHNVAAPNPNKLVKRSTSQSWSSVQTHGTPTVLRRPATSRQRSATMRQRSATDSRVDRNSADPSGDPNPFNDHLVNSSCSPAGGIWKPFFGPGRPCPEKRSGRRVPSARHRNRSPPRLVPGLGGSATLLLATDVTPESPFCHDFAEGTSPKGMARPVSCGFMEARHGSSSLLSPPSHVPEGKQQYRRHRPFPVEHSAVSATREWPVAASTRDFVLPIMETFQENSPRSHKQGAELSSSSRRPKTAAIGEASSHQHNHMPNAEDLARCSLRRVPSFVELRSERLSQGTTASQSSQQAGANCQLSPDEQPAGTRLSSGSSGPTMVSGRSQRHSAATSDPSSTVAGSDNDIKVFSSGEEDDTDLQSDTAFDSFSTRAAAGSKCSHRGPRIDTIFDQPYHVDGGTENISTLGTSEANVKSSNSFPGHSNGICGDLGDGRVRSPDNSKLVSSPDRAGGVPTQEINFPFLCSVSAPPMDQPLSVPTLEDAPDEPSFFDVSTEAISSRPIPKRAESQTTLNSRVNRDRSHSPATLSGRCEGDGHKSLFDWSEQQYSCKDGDANSRPRTANPKQVLDTRGGRSASRGPPHSLHLRSQSVPISRENSKSAESLKSTKFGTWGLGNKGVSEDWDGDFEFDDVEDQSEPALQCDLEAGDTLAMKVPKSIMERQETLHGQFGQVQELTVLVEELKRLRTRAKELHVLDGPSSELWREAQAIVNLATSDEEGEDKAWPSAIREGSPSSTSSDDFDLDWAFDNPGSKHIGRRNSYNKRSPLAERINDGISTMPALRGDSSAKAKRVLDNIYQKRETCGRGSPVPEPQQKMPFDTQSLRDLVVRAGVVTRALKDVVRRAEGVYVPDEMDPSIPDPPFRKIFSRPPEPPETLEI